jgi:uncharacterized membrane protein YphA (DoxX/SURF4 family)
MSNCCPAVKAGWGFAVAIVLLRVCVGFHFFKEGANKLQDPKPFSAMFFGGAKGPFAPTFQAMVWDADGAERFDADKVVAAWSDYVQKAKVHFGFDPDQVKLADEKLGRREQLLRDYLGGRADDIDEYFKGLKRAEANRADPPRWQVASLRGQSEKIEYELKAKRGPWLAEIDRQGKDLERDIAEVATSEQRAAAGTLAVFKPGRRFLDSEAVDKIIPCFDATLGILLVLGLFTRPAALVAAAFLTSVVASQWPGAYGAQPTYYQAVELCALLVLAAANAGRVAGLDTFVDLACAKWCPLQLFRSAKTA